jgi:hypothetical protein
MKNYFRIGEKAHQNIQSYTQKRAQYKQNFISDVEEFHTPHALSL